MKRVCARMSDATKGSRFHSAPKIEFQEPTKEKYSWKGNDLLVTFSSQDIKFLINGTTTISLSFPNSNMGQMEIYQNKCSHEQHHKAKGQFVGCSFEKLIYRSLYGGIDLEFIEDQQGFLKSNYYLQDYQQLSQLELEFVTTLNLQTNKRNHNLEFFKNKKNKKNFSQSEVIFSESIPIIIQNHSQFPAGYGVQRLSADRTRIKFIIDAEGNMLDKKKPFVIDPTYSSFLGGSWNDRPSSCKINEKDQSFFIVGSTESLDFPTTSDSYKSQKAAGDSYDGFITKFSITTGKMIWSSFLGSDKKDRIKDIVIDLHGNAIVTGNTNGFQSLQTEQTEQTEQIEQIEQKGSHFKPLRNFPTSLGNTLEEGCKLPSSIRDVIFIVNFTYNGDDLHWSNVLCIESNLEVISIDSPKLFDSELVIYGGTDRAFENCDFLGEFDHFIIKLTNSGTTIKNLLCFGGILKENVQRRSPMSMYLEEDQAIFLTGDTNSQNFIENTTSNSFLGGANDCFIVEINYQTFDVLFSSYYGTNATDRCNCIFYHNGTGLVWVGGSTTGRSLNTTENAFQPSSAHPPFSAEFESFFFAIHDQNKTLFYQSYFADKNSRSEISAIKVEQINQQNPRQSQIVLSGGGNLFGIENPQQESFNSINTLGNEDDIEQKSKINFKGEIHYDFGNGGYVVTFKNIDSLQTVYKSISVGSNTEIVLDLYNKSASSILLTSSIFSNTFLLTYENSFQQSYQGGASDAFFIYLDLVCGRGEYKPFYSNLCGRCPEGSFNRNNDITAGDNGRNNFIQGQSNFIQGQNVAQEENTFDNTCQYCELGTYSSNQGAAQCEKCPFGTFGDTIGLSKCFDCLPGTYNTIEGSTSQKSCVECPPGTYSAKEKTADDVFINTCKKCPTGSYNPYSGVTSIEFCLLCPFGTFNDHEGSTSAFDCKPCPSYRFSNGSGSTQCLKCSLGEEIDPNNNYCKPCGSGSYRDSRERACKKCEPGTFNNEEGMSSCYKCHFHEECLGGNKCNENRNPKTNCSTCQKGYYMLNFRCVTCIPRNLEILILILLIALFLALTYLMYNGKFSTRGFQNRNYGTLFWYFFQKRNTPIKGIILNYLQLFSALLFLKLKWPKSFLNKYIRMITSCFNLEFDTLFFNECNEKLNFITKMAIIAILFVLWFLIYWLYCLALKNRAPSNKKKKKKKAARSKQKKNL
ncbi:cell surface glycoprotein (s-layer protein)-like protein [Anaeramoeba flamelloides]|uniref:Cell surface glycoprotein (S-layer protein)-like protein n=1 Tax=Anaeramoeba flamelloides TaxID=1746091 RepID=A0AAV7YWB1_9EUKA|nr:cell surface glycoprotein (s-layer protein)-like protein [Anaeramoeba flamelloides]